MKYTLIKALIVTGLTISSYQVHAFFDVITGHFDDIVSRFAADEYIIPEPRKSALRIGVFDESAKGQDFLHNASGEAYIVEKDNTLYIQLAENFMSSPGPDYHVYISTTEADINDETEFDASKPIELGKLVKGSGASFYAISSDYTFDEIKSVTVYCKAFNEYIGSADLTR